MLFRGGLRGDAGEPIDGRCMEGASREEEFEDPPPALMSTASKSKSCACKIRFSTKASIARTSSWISSLQTRAVERKKFE